MIRKDFTVTSDFDGLNLQGTLFQPEGAPKGIVQLVHGMCERKSRYEDLMAFFAKNGYVAACHDQRGHGDSVKEEDDRGWFHDKHGKAIVDDCAKVTKYLKSEYPDLPVTLFGHSMGSMIVRCYIREYDKLIDKLIVCGSPSFNPLAGVAVLLARTIGFFKGERRRSQMLSYLSTGKGAAEFKKLGKGSWLSRDESVAKEFYSDPKCYFVFTCNGFENLFNLMKNTYDKKGYKVQNPDLPIHFVSGSDDPVLVNEKQWNAAVESMRKVGYKKVTGKLYQDMRHEIHNEIGKEEVYQDLLAFIEA